MLSKKTKFFINTIKRINIKEKADYLKENRDCSFSVPKLLYSTCSVREWECGGTRLVSIVHHDIVAKREAIYYHGGAYAVGVKPYHFYFIQELSKLLEARITLIDYPLAPANTVEVTFPSAVKAYETIAKQAEGKDLILLGDSAGGGLALAVAMYLRDNQVTRFFPKNIILYSPWLDISMDHPDMGSLESLDFILNRQALKAIGNVYRGALDLKDYRVSPFFGKLDRLGDIKVFYSTDELFYAECETFSKKTDLLETRIFPEVYCQMPHVWVMLPIEERTQALESTLRFVQGSRW